MLVAMSSGTLARGGNWHLVGRDAAVMAKNLIPGNPTNDGVFRQIEGISVDLPRPGTKRWVPRRKAAIVNAVHSGAASLEEVCRRYDMSVEEFITWQRAMEAYGVAGLRATRLQDYRHAPPLSSRSGAKRVARQS
jgi:transposase-like protein